MPTGDVLPVNDKSSLSNNSLHQKIRKDHEYPTFKRRSFKVIRKAPHPPTLLEKLLVQDVEKERDELLQCIRYVVDKNYFMK